MDAGFEETVAIHDAGSREADAAPTPDCTISRDVYWLDVEGSGSFQLGTYIFTNLGSIWQVSMSPDVRVEVSKGSGVGAGLEIVTQDGGPPSVGSHNQGGNATLFIDANGESCGLASGSFTLEDLQFSQDDAGVNIIQSLSLTFYVGCKGITMRGCLRYALQ